MRMINIHEAKPHLSRLVEQAAAGEAFIIAKAGRPLVQVTRLEAQAAPRRIGFMTGDIVVPDDVDRIGDTAIAGLFAGLG